MPILENEPITENVNVNLTLELFSKIYEDSIVASNKNMNCYEPFDLNFAYIKTRKQLKEDLKNLFEKHKIKYKNIGNNRFMVELKKEDASFCIKFDKLNIFNDIGDNDNNIRISVIKFTKKKGNYMSDTHSFENIIYKLK